MDLNLTPEQLEMCSADCRAARYTEALGEMEAAVQQWDDLDHLIEQGGAIDLDEALCGRDEAYQRAMLFAGVAAAYRPAVDPVALAREITAALARRDAEGGDPR